MTGSIFYKVAGRRPSAPLVAMFVMTAMCLHQPAWCQDLQVEQLRASAAGGHVQDDRFSLFSIVGGAAPSGDAENETFTLTSGGQSMITPHIPSLQFSHTSVGISEAGSGFEVSGNVEESGGLERAALHYRQGGEHGYSLVEMVEGTDGTISATIPGSSVTSRGVAYYIELTDGRGRTVREPAVGDFGVAVRIPDPGLASPDPPAGGSEQSAYRLLSVPLNLDAPAPEAVLGDELGPYDPDQWRFFELRFDQAAHEYPDTDPVSPGMAFWLITREPVQTLDTGSGVSVDPAETFTVPLHPRWNLIGNPFDFPISIDQVSLRSGEPVEMRSFDGAWNDPVHERVTELRPFNGYAVYNPAPIVDSLDFDPSPTLQSQSAGRRVADAAVDQPAWAIAIEARSGSARDVGNLAGVAESARSGLDGMDHPEPPSVAPSVSIYFTRPEWGALTSRFSTDIRPAGLVEGSWELEVESSTEDPVRLTFGQVDTVPKEYRVVLVDEVADVATDLRKSPTYELSVADFTGPRPLRLIVGSSDAVSDAADALGLKPGTIELDPVFPNPVGRSMTVRYGLPEAGHVMFRLYDAAGRLIDEITVGSRSPGYHSLVWQGSGTFSNLASGVYHLVLQVEDVRRARTFMIVH